MDTITKKDSKFVLSVFLQLFIRLVSSGVILGITAFFTQGFSILSIWSLIFATLALTLIDYFLVIFTGLQATPFGRGFIGFSLAVITLYILQFIIDGYYISWIASIFGAFTYGIIDYLIPSTLKG